MKKFIVKSFYFVDLNGMIQVKLTPEDVLIENYLAFNFELSNKSDIDTQIQELITEFTPIMFDKFQELESIPDFIKTQYEL